MAFMAQKFTFGKQVLQTDKCEGCLLAITAATRVCCSYFFYYYQTYTSILYNNTAAVSSYIDSAALHFALRAMSSSIIDVTVEPGTWIVPLVVLDITSENMLLLDKEHQVCKIIIILISECQF